MLLGYSCLRMEWRNTKTRRREVRHDVFDVKKGLE
jgi:hypothetical protein